MCTGSVKPCIVLGLFVQLLFGGTWVIGDGCLNSDIEHLIAADFESPAYVNSASANLLYQHLDIDKGGTDLVLSLISIDTNQLVKEVSFRAEAIAGVQRLRIPIADLPDGDYFAYIDCKIRVEYFRASGADDQANREGLERYLRKVTMSAPSGLSEPVEVSDLTMLFYDDWYLHSREGISRRFRPAEKFPIVSGAIEKDRVRVRGTGLAVRPDGSLRATLWNMDRQASVAEIAGGQKNYYVFVSEDDGETWRLDSEFQRETPAAAPAKDDQKDKQKTTWKFYDAGTDGPVNLQEVRVIFNAGPHGRPNWGDLDIRAGTGYAVWQKSETENVVLTPDPIVRQGPPGRPGKWSEVNDNWGGQWFSKDGKTLFFSIARLIPVFPPVSVPYDNLFRWKRQMTIWRSTDGINWVPGFFNTPTEIDGGGYQHYGMYVNHLENGNLYEAILYAYNAANQQVFLEIAHSRDGIYWERFDGHPPFAANSPPGGFAFGYMAGEQTVSSNGYDFLYLRYCSNIPHFYGEVLFRDLNDISADWLRARFEPKQVEKWPYWDTFTGSWEGFKSTLSKGSDTVGILRYRKDGKVSLDAEGDSTGVLMTKVLHGASEVGINAKTAENGKIRVEVLDAAGNTMEDYSGLNAAVFSGDETDYALKWKKGTKATLPGEPFRLRIEMADAELYALNWK